MQDIQVRKVGNKVLLATGVTDDGNGMRLQVCRLEGDDPVLLAAFNAWRDADGTWKSGRTTLYACNPWQEHDASDASDKLWAAVSVRSLERALAAAQAANDI